MRTRKNHRRRRADTDGELIFGLSGHLAMVRGAVGNVKREIATCREIATEGGQPRMDTNSHESGETGREWPQKGMRRHGKPQRKISSQLVINSDHCSAEDSRGRQNHVWQNHGKGVNRGPAGVES